MKKEVIKLHNISKLYKLYDKPIDRLKEAIIPFGKSHHKEFYALKDINFEIYQGQTVGIIGRNGSGKSTLLQIITGVLTPTSGSRNLNGKISALLELGAGFNPELTGIENIYLNGTIMGYSEEEIDSKLEYIASFAEIGEFLYQPVKTYSSGMFVRLAFAVAINVDPDILIVDEALAVGDSRFQMKCFRKFEDFSNSGKTILFVTHDLQTVRQYCDYVYLLEEGKIIDQGEPNKVVNAYYELIYSDNGNLPNFNEFQKNQTSERRYGNQHGEIISVDIFNSSNEVTDILDSCEECIIRVIAKAHKDILSPVIGFTIKTINGIEVFAMNTDYEGIRIPLQQTGERFVVEFRQKMSIGSGEYFLSSGLSERVDSEIIAVDRRLDFKKFTVIANNLSHGIANLNSKIILMPTSDIGSDFQNKPIPSGYLFFSPTNKCNYRCRHCVLDGLFEEKEQLTLDEINKIWSGSKILKQVKTYFVGGEPFYREDIPDIASVIYQNSTGINFTTNGFYGDRIEKTLTTLKDTSRATFILSIDGLESTHDKIRSKGAFRKAVATMKKLQKSHISFWVNTVMQELNVNELDEIKCFFKEENITHVCSPLKTFPGVAKYYDITEVYHSGVIDKVISCLSLDVEKQYVSSLGKVKIDDCTAGFYSCYIDTEGKVYPCLTSQEAMHQENFCMGNLRENNYDFDAIWFSERADKIRELVKRCQGCFVGCEISREIQASPNGLKLINID